MSARPSPRSTILATAAALAALFPAVQPASAQVQPKTCRGYFVGNITRGPDAGLALVGTLRVSIASDGKISGKLGKSRVATVTGALRGGSLSLAFKTRRSRLVITGKGRAQDVLKCKEQKLVGSLKGPRRGDAGHWGYHVFATGRGTPSPEILN